MVNRQPVRFPTLHRSKQMIALDGGPTIQVASESYITLGPLTANFGLNFLRVNRKHGTYRSFHMKQQKRKKPAQFFHELSGLDSVAVMLFQRQWPVSARQYDARSGLRVPVFSRL